MTREQVLSQYSTDGYRITSPGKFEGEALYVPYFWDAYLNGCADSDNGRILTFRITREDREQFPEIPARKRTVRLMESDSGFVCEC